MGGLLFDLANLARKLGIDAESALREANLSFEEQFRMTEEAGRVSGAQDGAVGPVAPSEAADES